MTKEPTLILYALLAALTAVQTEAITMASWVHILILAATAAVAAVLNRSVVTPVAKLRSAVAAVTKPVP